MFATKLVLLFNNFYNNVSFRLQWTIHTGGKHWQHWWVRIWNSKQRYVFAKRNQINDMTQQANKTTPTSKYSLSSAWWCIVKLVTDVQRIQIFKVALLFNFFNRKFKQFYVLPGNAAFLYGIPNRALSPTRRHWQSQV